MLIFWLKIIAIFPSCFLLALFPIGFVTIAFSVHFISHCVIDIISNKTVCNGRHTLFSFYCGEKVSVSNHSLASLSASVILP